MNAEIITEARPNTSSNGYHEPARPVVIRIDGVQWSSPVPSNAGEAQSYNNDAKEIVARLKGK